MTTETTQRTENRICQTLSYELKLNHSEGNTVLVVMRSD